MVTSKRKIKPSLSAREMRMLVANSLYVQYWRDIKAAGLESALADITVDEFKRICGLIDWRSLQFTESNISSTLSEIRANPNIYRIAGTLPSFSEWSTRQPSDRIAVQSHKKRTSQENPAMLETIPNSQIEIESRAEQYMMHGAVHPRDKITRRPSNDHLICESSFGTMVKYMPYKILGRKDMGSLNLFEHPGSLQAIPWCFRTTVIGIDRAVAEQVQFGQYASDETLVASLALRGGRICHDNKVEYPEDIIPNYEEIGDLMDSEYWEDLLFWGKMNSAWHVLSVEDNRGGVEEEEPEGEMMDEEL